MIRFARWIAGASLLLSSSMVAAQAEDLTQVAAGFNKFFMHYDCTGQCAVVSGTYNRYAGLPEMASALTAWAAHVGAPHTGQRHGAPFEFAIVVISHLIAQRPQVRLFG